MFQARRRAFARHPLCRVVEKKKGREERNGREVAEKREREREREKKKKKKKVTISYHENKGVSSKMPVGKKVSPGNKEAQN